MVAITVNGLKPSSEDNRVAGRVQQTILRLSAGRPSPSLATVAANLGNPVFDSQVGKCFKISIGRQDRELVLARESRKHHVHLRQRAAQSPQLEIDVAVMAGGLSIQRPQANVAQELRQ